MSLEAKLEKLEAITDADERSELVDRIFVECALAKAAKINEAPIQRTEFGAWGSTRCINGYNESKQDEQTSNSYRPSCQ